MSKKIGWGVAYGLTFVSFISFFLWFLGNCAGAKWIFLISFALQIYGIFTMKNKKNT